MLMETPTGGDGFERMTGLLERVLGELGKVREELVHVKQRIDTLSERVDVLTERFDRMLVLVGQRTGEQSALLEDLRVRVARLEARR